jgi:hypothetical protein
MIGDALCTICSDPAVLARLGGALGEATRAKALALRSLPDDARKRARAMAAALARVPAPVGFRGIHRSWIEAALAGLPERTRADLDAVADDPTSVWLVRWATASLVPLLPVDVVRPRSIAEATRTGADDLVEWLADVGADQLASSRDSSAAWSAKSSTTPRSRVGARSSRRRTASRLPMRRPWPNPCPPVERIRATVGHPHEPGRTFPHGRGSAAMVRPRSRARQQASRGVHGPSAGSTLGIRVAQASPMIPSWFRS